MSKFREKVQGLTMQTVGQMIGDPLLAEQGREQQQKAERSTEPAEDNTDHSSARREEAR